MDLIVNNDYLTEKLSDKGILTTKFDESIPSVNSKPLSFSGRNGKIDFGADYYEKKIFYEGYFYAHGQQDYENLRNWLYQLMASGQAFYITPLFDSDDMYAFERPGEKYGDAFTKRSMQVTSKKRFYVRLDETFNPEFVGNINGRLLYKVSIEFVTAELPFGETSEKDYVVINNLIPYEGTISCSQLEVPFYIEIVTKQSANGIQLTIGDHKWTYTGAVSTNDNFRLGGVYNTKNGISVNDDTNYQFFILKPSANKKVSVNCSINATITIKKYKELFI
ncbi:phage tail domain-containing protein [Leuconostoc fallax]|uniref:phage tail domain-containing protein n=1 Tax=Leuconostoc fallax TaxID=1251 RepID=UPI001C1ED1A1|nr:phage tail domain-containing protein [Leuconostoc fallax]MBU7455838.1 phage tail family protein [Leuconostoc fallax]